MMFAWNEIAVTRSGLYTERRRVPATSRADGAFIVCGLPSDAAVEASAAAPGRTSGLLEVSAPARGLGVRHLALGPTATPDTAPPAAAGGGIAAGAVDSAGRGVAAPARGTARLTGRVSAAEGGPVAGARIRVWGAAGVAQSDAEGSFALADLPAGTFTVEVRAIGREPMRVPVDLASARAASVRVVMTRPAAQLARVIVRGARPSPAGDVSGFFERKRTGVGVYLTAADIAKRSPLDVTEVLRTVPGLQVVAGGTFGNVVRARDCAPAVYLDGILMRQGAEEIDFLVRPDAVVAMEVYRGAGVPPQFSAMEFGDGAGPLCGAAIVIWTRR